MARPLADKLEEMHDELDLSSLFSIGSQRGDLLPVDQGPADGAAAEHRGRRLGRRDRDRDERHQDRDEGREAARRAGHGASRRSTRSSSTTNYGRSSPAPGEIGRLARTGNIPLGYYKDPERTAQVFFEHDGERYSIPGDFATVEADGQVTLLGRGSIVINTGGEKVFPEEVEGVLKAHPDVFDVLVVGVPDERWGERVTAVVQPRVGQGRRRSRTSTPTAGPRSPPTRRRSRCSSSTRSSRARAASPTTPGRRSTRATTPTDRR